MTININQFDLNTEISTQLQNECYVNIWTGMQFMEWHELLMHSTL